MTTKEELEAKELVDNHSNRHKRYLALLADFKSNGFSEKQSDFLIFLLDQYMPLI